MQMKTRFLNAIINGELGCITNEGIIITMQEFKFYFKDVKSGYLSSFMPAATIEKGRTAMTHTKFLFRIKNGVYRLHPEAIDAHLLK